MVDKKQRKTRLHPHAHQQTQRHHPKPLRKDPPLHLLNLLTTIPILPLNLLGVTIHPNKQRIPEQYDPMLRQQQPTPQDLQQLLPVGGMPEEVL